MSFKKQPIRTNIEGYKADVTATNNAINLLDQALEYSSKYVDVNNLDLRAFKEDMVQEFKRVFYEKHRASIQLEVKVEKILELLDVSITTLVMIQENFKKLKTGSVGISKNKYVSKVKKSDYVVYTRNDEQNKKLDLANKFIDAVNEIGKYKKVYPLNFTSGTSNFIGYDMRSKEFYLNSL